MTTFYKLALSLILFTFTTLSIAQTTIYVSPSGSNGNDGSQASPFQTIQFALSQMTTATTIEIPKERLSAASMIGFTLGL